MDQIRQLVPLLIPLVIVQLALLFVALRDLVGRERTRGPKWAWLLIILLFNLLGPIAYLMFGREE